MDLPFGLDPRDIFYTLIGLALLGLTLRPALTRYPAVNLPLIYVLIGIGLAAVGLPALDPRDGGLSALIVEHASELIVIISLTCAGLAIDTKETWNNWQAAYRLILIGMPLTIVAVVLLGSWWLGLSIAGAILLAGALAPTDPVLARSVQVSPPGKEDEPMEVALTAEAGLNDGLAFPFIYLAIAFATLGYAGSGLPDWTWSWVGYDLFYRVGMGIAAGYGCGFLISKLVFSPIGDASHGAWNSVIVILSATLIAYGVAESLGAYGFLAVFCAARAGRANSRGTEDEGYEKYVHHGADQLETILLALLLLWFGMFVGAGALSGLQWREVGFAVALIFLIRPLAGVASLMLYDCPGLERAKVAFFGIRGMGSIFYIAYAQNHGDFGEIDTIWRIAALTILISIVVHGFASNVVMEEEEEDETHPYREAQSKERA